ncbi:hypothetical protein AZ044_001273, partial [Pluralibacter gergoviae]
ETLGLLSKRPQCSQQLIYFFKILRGNRERQREFNRTLSLSENQPHLLKYLIVEAR